MACSTPSCNLYCYRPSLPISTSTTRFSLSLHSHSIFCGHHGISLHRASSSSRICAKFEKFQGEPPQESPQEAELSSTLDSSDDFEEEEEDDSCLPPDLEGAVRQSSEATALFVSSGGMRAIVCVQVDK